ncbi:MAG: guanylate kinase [Candidatus Eremiobacteraeota bacterium]|nr:guanylate kinase [Candidatus Eremiobacteraeota bacterium]
MEAPTRFIAIRLGESLVFGPGLLFVVSGPSGAGKDTLVDALRQRMPRLKYSVSATTRAPRPGENEGEHYFFLSRDDFQKRIASNGFLEHREYNGNLYGTPRDFVEHTLTEGYDLFMKPEVNGALAIKAAFPDAVLIFLLPDKFSHLRERLLARRTETNEEIARRLEIAHSEMQYLRNFDYIVINEDRREEEAVNDLEAIVRAERFRIHRYDEDSIRKLEDS